MKYKALLFGHDWSVDFRFFKFWYYVSEVILSGVASRIIKSMGAAEAQTSWKDCTTLSRH